MNRKMEDMIWRNLKALLFGNLPDVARDDHFLYDRLYNALVGGLCLPQVAALRDIEEVAGE